MAKERPTDKERAELTQEFNAHMGVLLDAFPHFSARAKANFFKDLADVSYINQLEDLSTVMMTIDSGVAFSKPTAPDDHHCGEAAVDFATKLVEQGVLTDDRDIISIINAAMTKDDRHLFAAAGSMISVALNQGFLSDRDAILGHVKELLDANVKYGDLEVHVVSVISAAMPEVFSTQFVVSEYLNSDIFCPKNKVRIAELVYELEFETLLNTVEPDWLSILNEGFYT